MYVDSKVVYGGLWSGSAWREPHLCGLSDPDLPGWVAFHDGASLSTAADHAYAFDDVYLESAFAIPFLLHAVRD